MLAFVRRASGDTPTTLRLLGPAGYTALGVSFVILLLIGGSSVLLATRNAAALALAVRTQDVRAAITSVVASVENAETGQRGFLLTEKADYLAPYEAAIAVLPEQFANLARLAAPDPEAAAMAAQVRAIADQKLDELAQTVALARSGDRRGAIAFVQTDRGQRDMDRFRQLSGRMYDSQEAVLTREIASITEGGRLLVAIDILGLAAVVTLAIVAGTGAVSAMRVLERAQGNLSRANAELATVNERLEEKVLQRTAALTEANEEIQRFAYIVSHDLRAPLVNIMGFTGELQVATQALARYVTQEGADAAPREVTEAANEDLPEAIRFIKASTSKMDRLIGAILKLSREGRRVLAPERVQMRQLASNIADTLTHQLEESGAELTVAPLPDIVTDKLAIEQVFSNLIENAIKYLKPGRPGRITIRGRTSGPDAIFEVVDNGRGIATRDLERVFELFRRAGDQTVPGEGIGLAHVRALVRRLGGKITCESAVDVGSTFRVQIPLVLKQAGGDPI